MKYNNNYLLLFSRKVLALKKIAADPMPAIINNLANVIIASAYRKLSTAESSNKDFRTAVVAKFRELDAKFPRMSPAPSLRLLQNAIFYNIKTTSDKGILRGNDFASQLIVEYLKQEPASFKYFSAIVDDLWSIIESKLVSSIELRPSPLAGKILAPEETARRETLLQEIVEDCLQILENPKQIAPPSVIEVTKLFTTAPYNKYPADQASELSKMLLRTVFPLRIILANLSLDKITKNQPIRDLGAVLISSCLQFIANKQLPASKTGFLSQGFKTFLRGQMSGFEDALPAIYDIDPDHVSLETLLQQYAVPTDVRETDLLTEEAIIPRIQTELD
jgi:hypothetical protein